VGVLWPIIVWSRGRPDLPFWGKFRWRNLPKKGFSRSWSVWLDGRDLKGGPRLCTSAQWCQCTSQWRL